jgi:hypothetical protein
MKTSIGNNLIVESRFGRPLFVHTECGLTAPVEGCEIEDEDGVEVAWSLYQGTKLLVRDGSGGFSVETPDL